jgi:hypothetical protein
MLGDSHRSHPARLQEGADGSSARRPRQARACDARREAVLAGRGKQTRWLIDGHAQYLQRDAGRVPTPKMSTCKVELLNPL